MNNFGFRGYISIVKRIAYRSYRIVSDNNNNIRLAVIRYDPPYRREKFKVVSGFIKGYIKGVAKTCVPVSMDDLAEYIKGI